MIVTFDPRYLILPIDNEKLIMDSIYATNTMFKYWKEFLTCRTLVEVQHMPKDRPIFGLIWKEVKEEKEMKKGEEKMDFSLQPGSVQGHDNYQDLYRSRVGDTFIFKGVKYQFRLGTGLRIHMTEIMDRDIKALEVGGIIKRVEEEPIEKAQPMGVVSSDKMTISFGKTKYKFASNQLRFSGDDVSLSTVLNLEKVRVLEKVKVELRIYEIENLLGYPIHLLPDDRF